jgi:hypothetical protein
MRRPEARRERMGLLRQVSSILAGVLLAPVAVLATLVEVVSRRGGIVYVEARVV